MRKHICDSPLSLFLVGAAESCVRRGHRRTKCCLALAACAGPPRKRNLVPSRKNIWPRTGRTNSPAHGTKQTCPRAEIIFGPTQETELGAHTSATETTKKRKTQNSSHAHASAEKWSPAEIIFGPGQERTKQLTWPAAASRSKLAPGGAETRVSHCTRSPL
jgi:hypothetical protein